MLMDNSQRYWSAARVSKMIAEVKRLGTFNLFTIGDDHGADQGHLFDRQLGLNPAYRAFFWKAVTRIHRAGLLAGVEPAFAWDMLRLYEREVHPHLPAD